MYSALLLRVFLLLLFLELLLGRELFPLISYKHSTKDEPAKQFEQNWCWLRFFLDLETKLEIVI